MNAMGMTILNTITNGMYLLSYLAMQPLVPPHGSDDPRPRDVAVTQRGGRCAGGVNDRDRSQQTARLLPPVPVVYRTTVQNEELAP